MAKNDSNTPESGAQIVSLPDGPDGVDGLTPRQRLIMDMITTTTAERGYPPSVREIADAVGLASPSSVQHQLGVLQKKGFINRDATRARALDVLSQEVSGVPEHLLEGDLNPSAAYVPLVGRIAAGGPILAEQAVEEIFPLPKSLVGEGELFMLKVSGDSMIDAAICDGDFVVVRRQPTIPGRAVGAPAPAFTEALRRRHGPALLNDGRAAIIVVAFTFSTPAMT